MLFSKIFFLILLPFLKIYADPFLGFDYRKYFQTRSSTNISFNSPEGSDPEHWIGDDTYSFEMYTTTDGDNYPLFTGVRPFTGVITDLVPSLEIRQQSIPNMQMIFKGSDVTPRILKYGQNTYSIFLLNELTNSRAQKDVEFYLQDFDIITAGTNNFLAGSTQDYILEGGILTGISTFHGINSSVGATTDSSGNNLYLFAPHLSPMVTW